MFRTSPWIAILFVLISCKSNQHTPKDHPSQQIIFGSSGGVTGMIREFVLLDNGQLFISKGIKGQYEERTKLKSSAARQFFKKAEEIGLATLTFNHPGNMTYYITVKDPKRSNTVKWGESGVTPPDGVRELYEQLMSEFNY